MIIGVPGEIKTHEYRVGMIPAGVRPLVREGHTVLVESGAGEVAGYPDKEYREGGARLIKDTNELWRKADLVVKVKEPQSGEYDRLRRGQTILCYLHLAPLRELTGVLVDRGVNAVALETIQTDEGHLPCLMPMSEIAGRMSIIVGANYLMLYPYGPGVLLGGVPGVPPCEVLVLGAGTAGTNAARLAAGLGAHVHIMDINLGRLAYLDEIFNGRITTMMSNEYNIERYVPDADLLVGAVLVPGEKAPVLVSGNLVKMMRKGSVIVDIAVDQGGCIETTHPTTHDDPVYQVHGVTHYCVANMPGAVSRTSTEALTNATFPYVRKIAGLGLENSASEDPALRRGINIYTRKGESKGMVTCEGVALAHGLPYVPCEKAVAGSG